MTHSAPDSATNLSRRTFLKRTGVTTLVLALGGSTYRASSQGVFASGQGAAYEPWTDWREQQEVGALRLVQSAILAASPHNTQPWLFRVRENSVELFADTSRHLGAMDPFLREMHLGLGCALENMMLTAEVAGYEVDLNLEPGILTGSPEENFIKVATLNLTPSEKNFSPLYDAIPKRHTDRSPYAAKGVEPEMLAAMTELTGTEVKLFLFEEGATPFITLAEETFKATEAITADPTMSRDSHAWFDENWQEVQRDRDGLFIDTAGVSPLLRAAVKMLPPTSDKMLDDGWLSGTKATLAATPVLGLLAVKGLYDKPQALQAGRAWQRLHLWATTRGLAVQPINQMLEIVDRERQLGQNARMATLFDELTQDPAWRPTFAFRLGYPNKSVLPSARRSVSEVLL